MVGQESEVVTEYSLYQLEHGQNMSVGMAEGETRDLGEGLEERTSYQFEITSSPDGQSDLVGLRYVTVYHTTRYPNNTYFSARRDELCRKEPMEFPRGTRFELIDTLRDGSDYTDLSSPVWAFQDRRSRILGGKAELPDEPPRLRIITPNTPEF